MSNHAQSGLLRAGCVRDGSHNLSTLLASTRVLPAPLLLVRAPTPACNRVASFLMNWGNKL